MKIKYISWIPAVILMILIFSFSAKQADESNESSLTVVHEIVHMYENITNIQLKTDMVDALNYIVRKSAHFCEYALLAITIAVHFAVLKWKKTRMFILPIIISFLYACTDEFHQLFVPGRAGLFKDVLIDTSGAATGSFLFLLIVIGIMKMRNGRRRKANS